MSKQFKLIINGQLDGDLTVYQHMTMGDIQTNMKPELKDYTMLMSYEKHSKFLNIKNTKIQIIDIWDKIKNGKIYAFDYNNLFPNVNDVNKEGYNLYREGQSVRGYIADTEQSDQDQLILKGLHVTHKNRLYYTVIRPCDGFTASKKVNKNFKLVLPLYSSEQKLKKDWKTNYEPICGPLGTCGYYNMQVYKNNI